LFVVIAGFINLFVGSASAKWAMMAPVFVPIMMQLGYSPELTQMAYRIADSSTNIITPLMTYFALIIAFAQKRSEEHTSELQSRFDLVCRLLLEKKNTFTRYHIS